MVMVAVCLLCIDGTISLVLGDQCVRLHSCVWLWCFDLRCIQCEVITSPSFPVKNASMGMVRVRFSWLNPWNDLIDPGRTDGTPILLCLTSKLLFVLYSVWRHTLTLIPCQNVLRWRWSVCGYVGSIIERFHWTWTNSKYVCITVLYF